MIDEYFQILDYDDVMDGVLGYIEFPIPECHDVCIVFNKTQIYKIIVALN